MIPTIFARASLKQFAGDEKRPLFRRNSYREEGLGEWQRETEVVSRRQDTT